MRTRLERAALVAVCMAVVIGCSDDDKGNGKLPDGGDVPTNPDGGTNPLDSGLDGSLIGRDAEVLPDGNIVAPPDSGNPITEPDSGGEQAACPGGCNDNVDCTIDSCVNAKCEHRVDNGFCAAGSSCSLTMGCQQGKSCSGNGDCTDMDGCTTNERCNTMLARCEYDVLDRDGDGYPPVSCGGTDCDDNRGLVNPSAAETCNNRDDDCDGTVDDNIAPVEGYVCMGGQVQCAQGFMRCGGMNGVCINLQTNHNNCGQCGNLCDSGETCNAGVCTCSASGTMCGMGMNASCPDITQSEPNCGGCGMNCPVLTMGGQVQSCIASACTVCGREGQACCGDINGLQNLQLTGCNPGLTCNGTKGTPTSKCECGAGSTKCGESCVDLKTSNANCGACGNACEQGETCITAGGASACQPCGGAGEACCNGLFCGNGLVCGPDDSCVVNNAGGGGPGGGGPGGGGPGGGGPGGG